MQDYDEIENFLLAEFVKASKNSENMKAILSNVTDASEAKGYTDENVIRALKDLYDIGFTNYEIDWSNTPGPEHARVTLRDHHEPLTVSGYRYWKENIR